MSERNDYKAYYYRPAIAKYHRISKEAADELEQLRGDQAAGNINIVRIRFNDIRYLQLRCRKQII